MCILAVSGDVGGARAIMPVLEYFFIQGCSFSIVMHGILAKESPDSWNRILPVLNGQKSLESYFKQGACKILLFSTSVRDVFPLRVARLAREYGLFVICLLDSWMNYRSRLEIDGKETFWPDIYAVMDEYAFKESVDDGIPSSMLRVVGHPEFGNLKEDYIQFKSADRRSLYEKHGLNPEKKLLVFISEPVEKDQGPYLGSSYPYFRGYTEKMILIRLCKFLQPFAAKFQLVTILHPRENQQGIQKCWEEHRGDLSGGIISFGKGRQGVMLADGVAGMASKPLYEAWLINKPVISLQPGLRLPHLNFLQRKEGCFFVSEDLQWNDFMLLWLDDVERKKDVDSMKSEIELHSTAAKNVAEIILNNLGDR